MVINGKRYSLENPCALSVSFLYLQHGYHKTPKEINSIHSGIQQSPNFQEKNKKN